MTHQSPPQRIGQLLGRAYRHWQLMTYAALEQQGFTDIRPAHSPVFRYVGKDGSRIVDLAEKAGITKQSMAYLVSDLEETGYVLIVPDTQDRRAKRVRLTAKGQKVEATLIRLSRSLENRLAQDIGSDQLETLRSVLASVVELDHAE